MTRTAQLPSATVKLPVCALLDPLDHPLEPLLQPVALLGGARLDLPRAVLDVEQAQRLRVAAQVETE